MNDQQIYAKHILQLFHSQRSRDDRKVIMDMLCTLDAADANIYKEYCFARDNCGKVTISQSNYLTRQTHEIRRSALGIYFRVISILYSGEENSAEEAEIILYREICYPCKNRYDR